MSYAEDIRRFSILLQGRTKEMLVGVAEAAHESITVGSPLTGAPGQPVDTSFLRDSWQLDFAPDFQSAIIGTNVAYAPVIEHNLRSAYDPAGDTNEEERKNPDGSWRRPIKSTVGGHHSVKLTVSNADNIQRHVLAQVAR